MTHLFFWVALLTALARHTAIDHQSWFWCSVALLGFIDYHRFDHD